MIVCPDCSGALPDEKRACPKCGFSPVLIDGFPAWAPELAHGGGGFTVEAFSNLAGVEEGSFWFRARNKLIIWAIRRYTPELASLHEIGCGTGYVLTGVSEAFPASRLVGSEIFVEGLKFAKTRLPNAMLVQMDARQMPYLDEFDAVIAADVLEHIEEDTEVLDQLQQALKPGGCLIVSVPQHRWLWSPADDRARHVRRYTKKDLHQKLTQAGFQIELSTSFVSILLPLMLGSRLIKKSNCAYKPREFGMPTPLNTALESVLNFERALIRSGLRFPLGGSRFIVAQKPV